MSIKEEDFYMFTQRDEIDSNRLTRQHHTIIAACDGQLLSSSIPQASIKKVADIATGNGLWLEQLRIVLPNPESCQYDGFDISTLQFPTDSAENIRFIKHDALERFPKEYHYQYDVVQIRFVCVAIKTEAYQVVVKNAFELLKPGGYFQWVDLEAGTVDHEPHSAELTMLVRWQQSYAEAVGFSLYPADEIVAAFQAVGLQDVFVNDYSTSKHPKLVDELRAATVQGFVGSIVRALLGTGQATNEMQAEKMRDEGEKAFAAAYKEGAIPRWLIKMIVGRKPS